MNVVTVKKEEHFETIRNKIPELDYTMGLATCAEDPEFYLELLNDFTLLTIKEDLEYYLKEKDAKNYCIYVHGFKNNAYSVGAKEIGDLAFELEKITRKSVFDDVPELQAHMFELFDSVCRRFHEVVVI